MSILLNISISVLVATAAALVGVYGARFFNYKIRKHEIYLISLAAGLLLANAFLHLLPEAIKLTPFWPYCLLVAIIIFYLLEQMVMIHSCREEHCENHAMGLMSLAGLTFHSLVDGLAIGVSFEAGFGIGLVSSAAIIFHKIAEGGCTYSLLICDNKLKDRVLLFSWMVALATPIGALMAYGFLRQAPASLLGILLALAAGSFIYISASDLLPATHKKSSWINILWFSLGVAFVFLVGCLAN